MTHKPTVAIELEPLPTSIKTCRDTVAYLADVVGAPSVADDARLLTSELATNAVIHGRKPYSLRAYWQPPLLRVEIIDSAPPPRPPERRPGTVGGWGLRLVEQIAHTSGTEPRGNRIAVWFTLKNGAP